MQEDTIVASGQHLTEWQQETLRAQWILTRNAAASARAAGTSQRTGLRWLNEHAEELATLAKEQAPALEERLDELITNLVSELFSPTSMQKAPFRDKAIALGVIIDKRELIAGRATGRIESGRFDPSVLSPAEKAVAAKLRAKMLHDGAVSTNGSRP